MEVSNISNIGIIISFALIFLVAGLSRYQKLGLERDIIISSFRALIQLLAIGYVIHFIFDLHQSYYLASILLIMSLVAATIPAKRGKGIPHIYWIAFLGIFLSTGFTITTLAVAKVISTEPKIIIPVGGMMIASAMNAVSILVDRLLVEYPIAFNEKKSNANYKEVRATLQGPVRAALRAATIPAIDMTKVTGLVSIPGVMAGMIIGGINPLIAVKYQIVILYMALCSYSLASIFVALAAGRTLAKHLVKSELAP